MSSAPIPVPAAAAARKRKRRTAASGAADDCFTCKDRARNCDRRRPYCSPCLEEGLDCAGYKTQLTWGVGVASRGKLRGLTLPIAPASPVQRSAAAAVRKARPRSASGGTRPRAIKIEPETSSMPVTPLTPAASPYDFSPVMPVAASPAASYGSPAPSYGSPVDWNLRVGGPPPPPPPFDTSSFPRQWPETHSAATTAAPILLRQQPLPPHPGRARAFPLSYDADADAAAAAMMSASLGSAPSFLETEYASSPLSQSYGTDDLPFRAPAPVHRSYSSSSAGPLGHGGSGAMPVPLPDHVPPPPTSCPEPFYAPSELASSLSSSYPQTPIFEQGMDLPRSSHGLSWFDDDGVMVPSDLDLSLSLDALWKASRPHTHANEHAQSHAHANQAWPSLDDDELGVHFPMDGPLPLSMLPPTLDFAQQGCFW